MPRSQVAPFYTLVQHSAFTGKGDDRFRHAVEEHSISEREAETVRKVGGLVFENYGEAYARSETENYPPEIGGLVPHAKGRFVRRAGIGSIYVPAQPVAA